MLIKRRELLSGAAALAAYGALRSPAEGQTCGTFYPTAPTPASNAGFSRLIYGDDFNVAGTTTLSTTVTTGFNWYPSLNGPVTSSNVIVNTTATAASISNGNTGGGLFPSGNGGILTLNGPNYPGNGNVTIQSIPPSLPSFTNPGYGCWGPNTYMEVYFQFNPACTANNQWYAPLWFYSTTYFTSGGVKKSVELDPVENYCGNSGYADNNSTFFSHAWDVPNDSGSTGGGGSWGTGLGSNWAQIQQDANWHAAGFLWISNGNNTGTFQPFWDNQPAVLYNSQAETPYSSSILTTGTGGTTGYTNMIDSTLLFALMGGPPGYNMNIDYVRIWGA